MKETDVEMGADEGEVRRRLGRFATQLKPVSTISTGESYR